MNSSNNRSLLATEYFKRTKHARDLDDLISNIFGKWDQEGKEQILIQKNNWKNISLKAERLIKLSTSTSGQNEPENRPNQTINIVNENYRYDFLDNNLIDIEFVYINTRSDSIHHILIFAQLVKVL